LAANPTPSSSSSSRTSPVLRRGRAARRDGAAREARSLPPRRQRRRQVHAHQDHSPVPPPTRGPSRWTASWSLHPRRRLDRGSPPFPGPRPRPAYDVPELLMGREPLASGRLLRLFNRTAARSPREARGHGHQVRTRTAVGTMSGGERQCLAIARAIHFGARVLDPRRADRRARGAAERRTPPPHFRAREGHLGHLHHPQRAPRLSGGDSFPSSIAALDGDLPQDRDRHATSARHDGGAPPR